MDAAVIAWAATLVLALVVAPALTGYSTGNPWLASTPPLVLGAVVAASQASVGEELALLAIPIAALAVLGALVGWAGVRLRRTRGRR